MTLPNCLHCGGQATAENRLTPDDDRDHWIICDDCGIQTATHDSPAEAEAAWRRRPKASGDLDEATGYAERLAVALHEKHYAADAPQWKPLSGDLIGILTQIDNMTAGLSRADPAPTVSGEPAGYLFELRYSEDRWSGTMFAAALPDDPGDVRFVRPLYLRPAPTRAEVLEEITKLADLAEGLVTALRALAGEKP